MTLINLTYKIVKKISDSEKYILVSQITRCTVSIPLNMNEETSKSTDKHFNTFIKNNLGSTFEWKTYLNYDKNYIDQEIFFLLGKIQQLQKTISSFKN